MAGVTGIVRVAILFPCLIVQAFRVRQRKTRVASKRVEVIGAAIVEFAQKDPVDIGHPVPTGQLTMNQVEQLNLKVWAQVAMLAGASVIRSAADPVADLDAVVLKVASAIDSGLAVHACSQATEAHASSCDIFQAPSENKNRYLDANFAIANHSIRLLVAEDADKASNVPSSFNVLVKDLQLDGSALRKDFVAKNLAPKTAGQSLDEEGFDWANSELIDALVTTTTNWPWKCTPREAALAEVAWNSGEVSVQSFPGAIYGVINDFLAKASGDWSVSFGSPVTKDSGIQFWVEYALCAHLMAIPVTIQSVA